MMKVILKLDFVNEKTKQKAMKKVSGLSGIESIALDPKDKKLTVTGNIDPIDVVSKLKKICPTEIVSVGPAKEPEKKKDEAPKKDDKKKEGGPKDHEAVAAQLMKPYYQLPYYYQNQHHHHQLPPPAAVAPPSSYPAYYQRSVEEDPNGCVIC